MATTSATHGITDLARAVRALAPTAVLTLDEEGGDVTRLHMRDGSPYPGNAALGLHDDVAATRAVASAIGAELASAGIWLNLAPCADINSDPRNPVIGTRSFGEDPALVARHTAAYVNGLASQGVAACLKHFPGHGDTVTDSHIALPHVSAPAEVLRTRELVPFAECLDAASIMTSHVVLEAFDDAQPATLSHAVLSDLLRDELGYHGVIISDALDMAGASAIHGIGGAAVLSLAAGADLLCLGPEPTASPSLITEAVDAVCNAVGDGRLEVERLAEAARRVARLRDTWTSIAPHTDAEQIIAEGRARSVRHRDRHRGPRPTIFRSGNGRTHRHRHQSCRRRQLVGPARPGRNQRIPDDHGSRRSVDVRGRGGHRRTSGRSHPGGVGLDRASAHRQPAGAARRARLALARTR